jgi:hypothetical protein
MAPRSASEKDLTCYVVCFGKTDVSSFIFLDTIFLTVLLRFDGELKNLQVASQSLDNVVKVAEIVRRWQRKCSTGKST